MEFRTKLEQAEAMQKALTLVKYFIGIVLDPSEDPKEKESANDFIRKMLFAKARFVTIAATEDPRELLFQGMMALEQKDYEKIFCELLDCNKEWFEVKLETAQAMI